MGVGDDVGVPKRKRPALTGQDVPAAKRPAKSQLAGAEEQEELRATVGALYKSYKSLIHPYDDCLDPAAFQAVLKAAEGDVASRRLAARLLPRFIVHFPDQVGATATALTRMHTQQPVPDSSAKQLEDQTRHDALVGLGPVLQAAKHCRTHDREQVVKLVLTYLFKLLPQAACDEPSEPEEEGELTPCDRSAVSMPTLKKLLRSAVQLHPTITLGHCFACLGAAAAAARSGSSGPNPSDPQLLQGLRFWMKEHLLKESTPSREGTPAADAGAPVGAAAGAVADTGNGSAVPGASRSCCLQVVLDSSEELQVWVMQQARGRAAAPAEVRSVLETALQLLPAHQQLVAAKPQLDPGPQHSPTAAGALRTKQQQQQHYRQQQQQQQRGLVSSGGLPAYRQQQQQGNGVVPTFINGMEPLGRSMSTPGSLDRDRARQAHSKPGTAEHPRAPAHQFPLPPGPICRVEACLLAYNLPPNVRQQEVQAALGAEEVWLMAGKPGSSSSSCACCTFKGVLEAAKAYLRHNGMQRFGPNSPAISLVFADKLPACSARAAAAAAAEPSAYVWATREAVGDAESITDELRAAGMQLNHVHRVNNAAEPGTLLQAPSAAHAVNVVAYLLKKHPQQHRPAAAEAAADEQELPPLPPEPPPAGEWQGGGSSSRAQAAASAQQQQLPMPPLPPGPPPSMYQQQQQERAAAAAAAGGFGRPASPAVQQQQQGYKDGSAAPFKRSYSSPAVDGAAAAAGAWRNSPGTNDWPSQQQQPQQPSRDQVRWGPAPVQQQQQQQVYGRPGLQQQQQQHGQPLPPAPPPGGSLGPDATAGLHQQHAWHTVPPPQRQQQQHRWGQPGHPGYHQHMQQQQHLPQQTGVNMPLPPAPPPAQGPAPAAAGMHPGGVGSSGLGPLHHLSPHQHQQVQGMPPGHLAAAPAAAAMPPLLQQQRSNSGGGGAGGSPAAMHHQATLPAGPPPPSRFAPAAARTSPGAAANVVLWQGSLVKQSVHMCGVACLHAGSAQHQQQHMAGFAPEPRFWPEALHVNFRISVADAVEQYAHTAPEQRAVRLLLPLSPEAGDTQQLQQFINYLNGKERAGMVKLPALWEQGLGPRAVYLIVPKAQVCQQLQVVWDGRDVMLIAVVVPQPGAAGGGGSAAGHRQHRG